MHFGNLIIPKHRPPLSTLLLTFFKYKNYLKNCTTIQYKVQWISLVVHVPKCTLKCFLNFPFCSVHWFHFCNL